MKFTIIGKNLEITDGIRDYIQEKLGKLERFFSTEMEMKVTLSVEKERQKVEVTLPVKGNLIRSEQVSSDMYVSIDLVEEVLERQLKKYKKKLAEKNQMAESFRREFLEQEEIVQSGEVKIIRSKHVELKPMFPEDACIQMELLGHTFFMFRNAQTDQVCVVYKRNDHDYGMIEPEE